MFYHGYQLRRSTYPLHPDQESVFTLTARRLGLKGVHTRVELNLRLERSLDATAVHSLRPRANLSDRETYQLIAPREEANRTVRIARVTARAQQAFSGQPEYAVAWLRQPKVLLSGHTRLQALVTESGVLWVEEEFIRIEHGMFA
jgi:putative toxin-antitoxin system antitoxin component (TIGR02293 family)